LEQKELNIRKEKNLPLNLLRGKTAIFIDLDGTLADSLGFLYPVYLQFLENNGVKGDKEEFETLNGPPIESIVQTLKEKYDFSTGIKELCDEYFVLIKDRYLETVKIFEGSQEFLEKAKERGLKLFLTTSNYREIVKDFLKKHKLESCFSSLFCGDDFNFNKSDPSYYIKIFTLAGVKQDSALIIEDSFRIIEDAQKKSLAAVAFCPEPRSPLPIVPIAQTWQEMTRCLNIL
jgi:phosphoglycolate phosphatase-like HAD superfamily hydrolase